MYIVYYFLNLYIKNVYNIYIIIIMLSLIFYYESNINSSIKYIYKIFKNMLIKYDDSYITITISEIHYSKNERYLKYVVYNNKLLDNLDVLKPIFNTLNNNDIFFNFCYIK